MECWSKAQLGIKILDKKGNETIYHNFTCSICPRYSSSICSGYSSSNGRYYIHNNKECKSLCKKTCPIHRIDNSLYFFICKSCFDTHFLVSSKKLIHVVGKYRPVKKLIVVEK